jgi:hypothetical protein
LEQFYRDGGSRVRCFKAMYNQLARPFALGYLLSHREIRVIHLTRQNLLNMHVSTLLMQKRHELQATRPMAPLWIRVNPEKAIAAMREAARRHQHFDALFSGHERLAIAYESLFDGSRLHPVTTRRICEFLGVSPHPMQSRIIKLNPRSLRDMVANFDELAEAVSHSEFSGMLATQGLDRARPAGASAGI